MNAKTYVGDRAGDDAAWPPMTKGSSLFKLLRFLDGRQRLQVLAAVALIVLQVYLDLRMPDFMAEITRLVETPGSAMHDVLIQGAYMLLCALGSAATAVVIGYIAARVSLGFGKTVRGEVFDHALGLSKAEADHLGAASLVNRCTNDITQIQMVITMGLQAAVKAPIMAVWAIVKIVGYGWQWSVATACAAGILSAILAFIFLYAVPRFRMIQKLSDNVNRLLREHLAGIRPVRAYNAESFEQERFAEANDRLTSNNLSAFRAMVVMFPGMSFIVSALTLSIYWIGAYLVDGAAVADKLTYFSEMVVFSNYAMQVIMSFMMLNMVFIMLPRAQVSARRVLEVMESRSGIVDGRGVGATEQRGTVEFVDVSFGYPDGTQVLKDISFKVDPGQVVAIVGATGSGKTTLLQLVNRLYDVTSGTVLVDGRDVRSFTLEELRNRIGYVPQTATLFSGTVASNVGYGSSTHEVGEGDIERALRIAQAGGFVGSLDGGIDARIEKGGHNVSGGQRQRLAIARAIARDPEILAFDDSFSALDYNTDRALRSALEVECPDTTMLIVAQRVSSIRNADRIIVLDSGRIVGQGTHAELVEDCPVYREIVVSQNPEEVEAYAGA